MIVPYSNNRLSKNALFSQLIVMLRKLLFSNNLLGQNECYRFLNTPHKDIASINNPYPAETPCLPLRIKPILAAM